MNCEDYRRAIAAEPDTELGHAASCAACRAYRDELRALDVELRAALELPLPALELPELPQLDTADVAVLPRRRPLWLAAAASVAAIALVAFMSLRQPMPASSLAEEILAHLEHEPYALEVTDRAVSDERLARIVPARVATLDHEAGLITYAQSCVIRGQRVPHLVLQGARGPVTILLMPEQKVDAPEPIEGRHMNGVILPVGDGSIAIIGDDGEDLRRIEMRLRNSVAWTT